MALHEKEHQDWRHGDKQRRGRNDVPGGHPLAAKIGEPGRDRFDSIGLRQDDGPEIVVPDELDALKLAVILHC